MNRLADTKANAWSRLPALLDGFLKYLASACWSMASATARAMAGLGWLKTTRLDARVVSVGNIQAGGAGKTPLVALIAREARQRGLQTVILCRGYGSAWELEGGHISPGEVSLEAEKCGDEAALLHDLAPDAYLGVGADRVRQFELLQKKIPGKIDLVILDDGFQHWKIRKDFEVVAVTSAKRSQRVFRDWSGALRRADLLVWTKGHERPRSFGRPLVKVKFQVEVASGSPDLHLVTGIGDGSAARALLEEAGYRVRSHLSFPDHARYDRQMAQKILASARASGCQLAMTGKDWVKWREFGISREEVRVFEPVIVFEEGRELWDRILWG